MTRDKLNQIKGAATKVDFESSTQLVRTLIDHGLEVLTELEGGASVMEQRAQLKERERQVGIAIAYLADMLKPNSIAGYTIDAIHETLRSKGPQWTREWAYYVPRVEEEFGV